MQLVPSDTFTIEELTDIYNQTRVDYLVPMPMSVRRLQEYIDIYDVDLSASVVARLDDETLGVCMLGVRDDRAWVTRLGVLPTSRRHGAGQAMMEHVINQAVERNLRTAYLEVITGNTPAYRLFVNLGFEEIRSLLILRRPPGPSAMGELPKDVTLDWLEENEVLSYASQNTTLPAWTNQVESLRNAGNMRGLHLVNHTTEMSGWISYQRTALQIKRITVGALNGHDVPPAFDMLSALHNQFPKMDTIAENIPANAPYIESFFAHRYVKSFSRIEMKLKLS